MEWLLIVSLASLLMAIIALVSLVLFYSKWSFVQSHFSIFGFAKRYFFMIAGMNFFVVGLFVQLMGYTGFLNLVDALLIGNICTLIFVTCLGYAYFSKLLITARTEAE